MQGHKKKRLDHTVIKFEQVVISAMTGQAIESDQILLQGLGFRCKCCQDYKFRDSYRNFGLGWERSSACWGGGGGGGGSL